MNKLENLQKALDLLEIDLNSRIACVKDSELENKGLLRNFWFRQLRDTLGDMIARKMQLQRLFSVFVEKQAVLQELFKNRPHRISLLDPEYDIANAKWFEEFEKAFVSEGSGEFVVVPRAELERIRDDDVHYISKKDLANKLLEGVSGDAKQ